MGHVDVLTDTLVKMQTEQEEQQLRQQDGYNLGQRSVLDVASDDYKVFFLCIYFNFLSNNLSTCLFLFICLFCFVYLFSY